VAKDRDMITISKDMVAKDRDMVAISHSGRAKT